MYNKKGTFQFFIPTFWWWFRLSFNFCCETFDFSELLCLMQIFRLFYSIWPEMPQKIFFGKRSVVHYNIFTENVLQIKRISWFGWLCCCCCCCRRISALVFSGRQKIYTVTSKIYMHKFISVLGISEAKLLPNILRDRHDFLWQIVFPITKHTLTWIYNRKANLSLICFIERQICVDISFLHKFSTNH